MPIRPENKHRYPDNWKEIRAKVLERAGHKCEQCSVMNHQQVLRAKSTDVWIYDDGKLREVSSFKHEFPDWRSVYIVLTIAHLDHIPENCDLSNLRAWCQKCHNSYDAPFRAKNRKERRNAQK